MNIKNYVYAILIGGALGVYVMRGAAEKTATVEQLTAEIKALEEKLTYERNLTIMGQLTLQIQEKQAKLEKAEREKIIVKSTAEATQLKEQLKSLESALEAARGSSADQLTQQIRVISLKLQINASQSAINLTLENLSTTKPDVKEAQQTLIKSIDSLQEALTNVTYSEVD